MKIGSRSLGELLYRTSGVIGTCKGLIGTSWGLPKSRNPTQTLCFPSVCLGLAWIFDGTSMGCWWQLSLASALVDMEVIGPKNAGVGPADDRLTPSREVSHRRWHRRARSRGGAHVMASWRRASHMLRTADICWYVEGLWLWPKGSQDVSLQELGQSHNNSTRKIARNTLAVAWAWLFVRVWKKMEESRSA